MLVAATVPLVAAGLVTMYRFPGRAAFEWALLNDHLAALTAGATVEVPGATGNVLRVTCERSVAVTSEYGTSRSRTRIVLAR